MSLNLAPDFFSFWIKRFNITYIYGTGYQFGLWNALHSKNVSIMYLFSKLILHEAPGRESYQRVTSIVLSPSFTILPIGPRNSYL